jgi:hypothetical protein
MQRGAPHDLEPQHDRNENASFWDRPRFTTTIQHARQHVVFGGVDRGVETVHSLRGSPILVRGATILARLYMLQV